MTEDRAPCPFCGNASVQLTSIRDGYEAWCKCGASMTASNPDSRNKVIAKWNARATPSDDLRAESERLRAALKRCADFLLDQATGSVGHDVGLASLAALKENRRG